MSIEPAAADPRHRRRDERRQETRLLLLEASALLFARHGYHVVSLDAVAEEAGFTKGAVYSHFASKQDLLASLLELHCERQLTQIRSLLDEPKPLDERIRQLTIPRFGSSGAAQDWCLLFVELWLQAMREPSLRPRLAQLQRDTRAAVAEMIEREAKKLGLALVVPANEVAQEVVALGDGLMMQHLIAPSRSTASAYRSGLRALFRAATGTPDQEGASS